MLIYVPSRSNKKAKRAKGRVSVFLVATVRKASRRNLMISLPPSSVTMQTSLMPARPPPPPPADSHVLRTRASPSATTNAVDYTDEELMGPEGAMMGRDDSKIVCKFSPVSNGLQFDGNYHSRVRLNVPQRTSLFKNIRHDTVFVCCSTGSASEWTRTGSWCRCGGRSRSTFCGFTKGEGSHEIQGRNDSQLCRTLPLPLHYVPMHKPN